jgi:hypothetical protein
MCALFEDEDINAVRAILEDLDNLEERRKWVSKNLVLGLPGSSTKSAYYLPKKNKMARVCSRFFQLVLYLAKAKLSG